VNPEVTFKVMLKQVPIRLAELIVKLLSFKGAVIAISTWLTLSTDVFDGWMLLGLYAIVIFDRDALKILEHIWRQR